MTASAPARRDGAKAVLPHKEILLGFPRAAVDRGEAGPGALGPVRPRPRPAWSSRPNMEHGTVSRAEVEALVDEVLMPLFTAGAAPGNAR
ncbi:hypothetical protein [Streptomyces sp. NPDC058374]|uniref:hypothetical protein n=1 Tax=unclassified Streptomyces TaxID=2593676 RepID=UPI00364FB59C